MTITKNSLLKLTIQVKVCQDYVLFKFLYLLFLQNLYQYQLPYDP